MSFVMLLIVVWGVAMRRLVPGVQVRQVVATSTGSRRGCPGPPRRKAKKTQGGRAAERIGDAARRWSPRTAWRRCWWTSTASVPRSATFLSRPASTGRRRAWCICPWWLHRRGFAVAWLMLPFGKPLAFVVGAGGRLRHRCLRVDASASSRLKRFEEIFPEALEFVVALHARRPRLFGVARNDSPRVSGAGVGRVPPHLRGAQPGLAHRNRAAEAGASGCLRSTCTSSFRRCCCRSAPAATWRKFWTSWPT